jgi:hypothetical protein
MDDPPEPSPLNWINKPLAKRYLQKTDISNDPIIIVEFSEKNKSSKVALSRLRELFPPVACAHDDGALKERVRLELSKEAFSMHVSAHFVKHEMGIDISDGALCGKIKDRQRANMLNMLHAYEGQAGAELLATSGILDPEAFVMQVNLFKKALSDFKTQFNKSKDVSNIRESMFDYYTVLLQHILRSDTQSAIYKSQVAALESNELALLFLLPRNNQQIEELIKYENTFSLVASFMFKLFLFRIKYPKAPQFSFSLANSNSSDFKINQQFHVTKRHLKVKDILDGSAHQYAYEINAGSDIIHSLLEDNKLTHKFDQHCQKHKHRESSFGIFILVIF